MSTIMKLLEFEEQRYQSCSNSIYQLLETLKDAAKQLQDMGMSPEISPRGLAYGNIYGTALAFYKDMYETSDLSRDLTFDQYLKVREVNIEPLKVVEQRVREQLEIKFSFYKNHHAFYSYFEHRPDKDLMRGAGKKIQLPITSLFKWVDDYNIEITLERKYFELYANSDAQLEKIADLENYIAISKKVGVDYGLVSKAIGRWLKELSHDLNSYRINYHEILKTIN